MVFTLYISAGDRVGGPYKKKLDYPPLSPCMNYFLLRLKRWGGFTTPWSMENRETNSQTSHLWEFLWVWLEKLRGGRVSFVWWLVTWKKIVKCTKKISKWTKLQLYYFLHAKNIVLIKRNTKEKGVWLGRVGLSELLGISHLWLSGPAAEINLRF